MEKETKKINPKNPKKITTTNIDKNSNLSKENKKLLKILNFLKN